MWSAIETLKTYVKKKKLTRVWLGKANKQFFARIISPVIKNRIEFIAFIIDGGKGSGKTTKACSIYKKILETITSKYNEEIIFEKNRPISDHVNLIAVRSLKQAIYRLDNKSYQVVIIDDAARYNKKIAKDVMNDFHEIRHVFGQLTPEGVLIILWTVQDSFLLQKVFRKDLSGYIWTDTPLSESDQHFINRNSCYRGLAPLANWSKKIKDEKKVEYLSRCIVSTESWAGWLEIPMSKDPRFRPYHRIACPEGIRFISPEEDSVLISEETIKQLRPIISGDIEFKLIEKGDSFELIKKAIREHEKLCKILGINLDKRYFEAFDMRYLQGYTVSQVAQHFGYSSDATMSNSYEKGGWFAKVLEEYIGHAIEYILTQENQLYEGFERIAGNEHIDLRKDSIGVEVKTRSRKETPTESWLSNHTLELLLNGETSCSQCAGIEKFELILVVCRVNNFNYYRYSVNQKSADSAVDSQSSVRSLQPPSPSSSSSFPSAVEVCIPSGESVLSGETVGDVESVEGSGEGGRGVEENLGKWGL